MSLESEAYSRDFSRDGIAESDSAYSLDVPAIYRELCQFPEQAIEGSEGTLASPELTLRAVVLAHRHGERSPLLPVHGDASPPDCSAYNDIDRHSFDEYTRLVDSEEFRSFLGVDEMFAGYPWYPARSQCTVGNMTAVGALQLAKLGAFLRGKYEHAGIFQVDRSLHISVAVSPFPRTFQSAIALTSSFLFPFRQQLGQVHLRGSKNTFFCLNEKCVCRNAVEMRNQYDLNSGKYFVSSPTDVRKRLQDAASAVGLEQMEHGPIQFVDLVLGRYICRRLPLPCQSNKCVTSEDVVLAADEASRLMERVGELESSRKLHVAEANAILNELVETLRRVAGSTSPKSSYVKVFSGHDSTLQPLLTVLGIRHRMQDVHYASRLAFEARRVYERVSNSTGPEKKLLIRVVYNGVDRTHEISFCQPLDENLCPANRFEDFAEKGLFDIVSGLSLSQICNA